MEWDEVAEEINSGDLSRAGSRWSCGRRIRGIEPGDRAYLLRQGVHGRGVVAVGEIISEPYPEDSWRGDGSTAQYVDVSWEEADPSLTALTRRLSRVR